MAHQKSYDDTIFEDPEVPIQALDTQQGEFALHHHTFTELVIVVSGSGEHFYKDNTGFTVTAGDVFIIHPGISHAYANTSGLRILNVLFKESLLTGHREHLDLVPGYQAFFDLEPRTRVSANFEHHLKLAGATLDHALSLVSQLQKEEAQRTCGYQLQCRILLVQLILFLARQFEQRPLAGTTKTMIPVARAITHICRNYPHRITLDELAHAACVSKRSLIRQFGAMTDLSPVAYIIALRIDKSLELLGRADLSINEIALKTGFNDNSYFCRQFKKAKGISPVQYRKKLLAGGGEHS